jgi:hypothetical protein
VVEVFSHKGDRANGRPCCLLRAGKAALRLSVALHFNRMVRRRIAIDGAELPRVRMQAIA